MSELTLVRRREIVSALRNGTVPRRGIETLAVGLDRYVAAIDEELNRAALGHGVFKAVRGDYGTGKTFFARWVQHRAQAAGFATAEVQISETETPLHRMETVYRRALESLRTREWEEGAFRSLVDRWFYALEEEVLARPGFPAEDASAVAAAVGELLEQRLSKVSATQPQFAAALRACHRARVEGDAAVAEGLLAWLMGQPNVSADIKRKAGLKGEIDHFGAGGFLRGLLSMLQQTGRRGLFLVLDEVETIQRMRGDVREKSLNAMRQLLDEVDSGRYPGLYLTDLPPLGGVFGGGIRGREPLRDVVSKVGCFRLTLYVGPDIQTHLSLPLAPSVVSMHEVGRNEILSSLKGFRWRPLAIKGEHPSDGRTASIPGTSETFMAVHLGSPAPSSTSTAREKRRWCGASERPWTRW